MLYKIAAGILLLFGGVAALCVGIGYAGYALYAAVTPPLGAAAAAAITGAVFLLVPLLAWLFLLLKGRRRKRDRSLTAASPEAAALAFLSGLAKDRPIIGIALAGLVGAAGAYLRKKRKD